MRLKDKVAIITGAGGGMGQAIVQEFLKEGANVVAVDLMMNRLPEDDERCFSLKVDVTNEEEIQEVVEKAVKRFGRVDCLVNVAGIAQAATPIEEISSEAWDKILTINTKSLFLTSKAVVPLMKSQHAGVIVNIASIAAVRPRPGLSAYVASKGAAVTFSQALAIELADYKIRVNVVNPGPSNTNMLAQFAAEGTNVDEAKQAIFKKSVPLGELLEPKDIANACLYLCSDESKMVTGAVFNIDGGRGI